MATQAARRTLRRAQAAALKAMSTEELDALVATFPADPELDFALPLLTESELEAAAAGHLTRRHVLALARGRAPGS